MSDRRIVPGLLIGIILGAIVGIFISNRVFRVDERAPVSTNGVPGHYAQALAGDLLQEEKNTIEVFQKSAPSVVFITSKALRRDLFSLDVFEIPQGSGSGFIWDSDGHVVTNYHVIADADALTVTLSDHTSYEAEVVGAEPNKDLAVLKIGAPAEQLRPVPVGSSSDLLVGQKVLAIGNPFGLDQTLTVGVVSATGREIKSVTNRTIRDVIQTDTAINPGNSGGPLLDSRGNLVGVNTSILSPSGAYAGVGFAVPVNTVKNVVPQLIQFGKVIRPGLGVNVLADSIAARLDIEGVIINDVIPGSSAEDAGLKGITQDRRGRAILGDVIIAIDNQRVRNSDEMSTELEQHKIGDTVSVRILRDDKEQTVQVKLQQIN